MKRDPLRNAGPRGAAASGDAFWIDFPLLGFGPQELNGARAVEHLHRIGPNIREPVIDRSGVDACSAQCLEEQGGNAFLVSGAEAAAMDKDEQRRRFLDIRLPEIEHVALMRAIRYSGEGGRRFGRASRPGFGGRPVRRPILRRPFSAILVSVCHRLLGGQLPVPIRVRLGSALEHLGEPFRVRTAALRGFS
ncbi:MAG: hypothetical protein BWZ10_02156 [candidate division BRC1 bacterium ADurb.BinA364]|nr:MAG: hypothetical protein BWZ10_02156 [candidate division BRC1 bacterium ADurb.BinA364]